MSSVHTLFTAIVRFLVYKQGFHVKFGRCMHGTGVLLVLFAFSPITVNGISYGNSGVNFKGTGVVIVHGNGFIKLSSGCQKVLLLAHRMRHKHNSSQFLPFQVPNAYSVGVHLSSGWSHIPLSTNGPERTMVILQNLHSLGVIDHTYKCKFSDVYCFLGSQTTEFISNPAKPQFRKDVV